MNFAVRQALYRQIETERNTRVIAFVTGDRPSAETQIALDAFDAFVALLDDIGPTEQISLILHTDGGSVSAAWRLINLIRTFCDKLEVLIPVKALSAGTLMSLGAHNIVMTKQAALGPIDPSLDHPLGPTVPGLSGPQRVNVSAEAIQGYLKEASQYVTDGAAMATVWTDLARQIHPVVLGEVFRRTAQIRFLASKLIEASVPDEDRRQAVIDLLCSDSGSHDYTINRREAAALGITVETPSAAFYQTLNSVAKSYSAELEVLVPFSPAGILGGLPKAPYSLTRGLIESTGGGCYGFMTKGEVVATGNPAQPFSMDTQDEGWRKIA